MRLQVHLLQARDPLLRLPRVLPQDRPLVVDMTAHEPVIVWSPTTGEGWLAVLLPGAQGEWYPLLIHGESTRDLPGDVVRFVPYRIRSYWTSQHTWADPDCFECGGEGAPCCEPPDYPWPGEAIDQNELDRLRAQLKRERDRIYAPFTDAVRAALNTFQHNGRMHPFTCPKHSDEPLLAARHWVCLSCDYTQYWAHAFMAETPAPIEEADHG